MDDERRRAAVAERAARAGGVVASETFREHLAVEEKSGKTDLVTVADRDAQQQVLATIQQEFHGEPVVCEEEVSTVDGDIDSRDTVPESGPAWVVDPIDGTTNYVHGLRFWGTSVVALRDGDPVGVATHMPAQGDSYTAGPESVTRNGETLAVSERTDPETFAVGLLGRWSNRQTRHLVDGLSTGFGDIEGVSQFGDLRRMGAMQGELALVADGGLDAVLAPSRPDPWDAIGGVHLVRRAGGTVTDASGERWHRDSDALVASNGRAHEAVVAAVSEALGPDAAE